MLRANTALVAPVVSFVRAGGTLHAAPVLRYGIPRKARAVCESLTAELASPTSRTVLVGSAELGGLVFGAPHALLWTGGILEESLGTRFALVVGLVVGFASRTLDETERATSAGRPAWWTLITYRFLCGADYISQKCASSYGGGRGRDYTLA